LYVIKVSTRGAAKSRNPTAGGIFPKDELVKILKHEAKILFDLCEEINEDLQSQEARRENPSIFYEIPRK
jgi:hypothetical protein